jgi:Protein of unknown function (DUF2274)
VADLKLGPLPRQSTVRLTIVLLEPLKEELDAYAAEHSRLYVPVETAACTCCRRSFAPIAPGAAAENRFRTKPRRTRPHNSP